MSSKPSWDGKHKQFTRMMKGNGYTMTHQKARIVYGLMVIIL